MMLSDRRATLLAAYGRLGNLSSIDAKCPLADPTSEKLIYV
jgi:hypothetical protein